MRFPYGLDAANRHNVKIDARSAKVQVLEVWLICWEVVWDGGRWGMDNKDNVMIDKGQ